MYFYGLSYPAAYNLVEISQISSDNACDEHTLMDQ